jgi:putative membrane protein
MENNRGLVIALAVLVAVLLLTPMLGSGMMGPGMMWGWWGGQPGNVPTGVSGWIWGLAMGLGMLGMLAFWGALIVGVALIFRALLGGQSGQARSGQEAPLEILQRRYAAGEITREQFEEMRRVLEQR